MRHQSKYYFPVAPSAHPELCCSFQTVTILLGPSYFQLRTRTRVLEQFTPLIILSRDYFVEIVLLDCKISGTISPKSAISSFYSAQISRISTKCYFFRHLGRTGRKCTYYFYQETISTFYYVKIHTISPKYNFYLLFSYRNSQRPRC